jgi:hypothetical protein
VFFSFLYGRVIKSFADFLVFSMLDNNFLLCFCEKDIFCCKISADDDLGSIDVS